MTQQLLKLVSLNIEHDKHYDLALPFLRDSKADVILIQELFEPDFTLFERELGMKCYFAAMVKMPSSHGGDSARSGIAIFTRLPVSDHFETYYGGSADNIPYFSKDPVTDFVVTNKVLLGMRVAYQGETYTFATTHFTWSNHGMATDEQRSDLKAVFSILDGMKEFVLAGDFNAPRGREIFTTLAARYKDNIPSEYTTSIDKNIHRAGDLGYMVDGLFTTLEYAATDVRLVSGVSDHMAISAHIKKSEQD